MFNSGLNDDWPLKGHGFCCLITAGFPAIKVNVARCPITSLYIKLIVVFNRP